MKRILHGMVLGVFLSLPALVVAQNLSLTDTVEHVYGTYDQFELISEMEVFNNKSIDMDVKVKRIEGSLVAGMDNAICWEQCYLPSVSISPTSLTIPAGGSVNNFSGHVYPNQLGGDLDIYYVFFDVNNPNDSVMLHVYYKVYGLSVGEEERSFKMYPNPTSGVINVELTLPSSELPMVYTALGRVVKTQWTRISDTMLRADLRTLPKGIYFVKFGTSTERIVLN
jgi:hypothetical protein